VYRIIAIDFGAWFGWLALFAITQRRMCRRYPGIRSVCRLVFLVTAGVALLPGIWLLFTIPHNSPRLLLLLNHAFGIGVYLQTGLRAMFTLKWLVLGTLQCGQPGALDMKAESDLLAMLAMLPQVLRSAPGRATNEKTGG
jgi:hypothetical protein